MDRVSKDQIVITVVVPTYNEEWAIFPLWQKLSRVAAMESQFAWRFLFVNDGSTDRTGERLSELATEHDAVSCVQLRRNYGLTQALQAGFDHASGDYIVTISANLQNDPADIPMLIAKLGEGADVCAGWRRDLDGGRLTRQGPRWLINWIISKVSGVKLHDYDCSLRAYRLTAVQDLQLSGNLDRYIPVYVAWRGGRVVEAPVTQLPRSHGLARRESAARRSLKTLLDLVFLKFLQRYSYKPFYVFGGLGVASIVAALLAFALALFYKFTGQATFIETPLPLLTALFFLSGVLLVSLGIIAEFLIRVYRLQAGREFYQVERGSGSGD